MLTTEQITQVYEELREEDWPNAGIDVRSSRDNHHDALGNYITAIQYETFLYAYAKGYEAGRKSA